MDKKRQFIFDKYNGKCAYCGCELQKLWHIDHIEPIVRDWMDGSCKNPHLKDNVKNHNPSCPSCNIQKKLVHTGTISRKYKAICKLIKPIFHAI